MHPLRDHDRRRAVVRGLLKHADRRAAVDRQALAVAAGAAGQRRDHTGRVVVPRKRRADIQAAHLGDNLYATQVKPPDKKEKEDRLHVAQRGRWLATALHVCRVRGVPHAPEYLAQLVRPARGSAASWIAQHRLLVAAEHTLSDEALLRAAALQVSSTRQHAARQTPGTQVYIRCERKPRSDAATGHIENLQDNSGVARMLLCLSKIGCVVCGDVYFREGQSQVGQATVVLKTTALVVPVVTDLRSHDLAMVCPQHSPHCRVVRALARHARPLQAAAVRNGLETEAVRPVTVVIVACHTTKPT